MKEKETKDSKWKGIIMVQGESASMNGIEAGFFWGVRRRVITMVRRRLVNEHE